MFNAPLPWYVAGPLIGLVVPALLLIGGKQFGVSANLRHLCALGRRMHVRTRDRGTVRGARAVPARRAGVLHWRPAHHARGASVDAVSAMSIASVSPSFVAADQDGASLAREHTDVQVTWWQWLAYFAVGLGLGVVFVESQVLSWYRIQEMFRFQNFHMFGVIGTAAATAAVGRWLLSRGAASAYGEPKEWTPPGTRYWLGGFVFGLGWALLGACPGPIFTLIGMGHLEYLVPLLSALAGTYAYGACRHQLPH
jgi:uncharacterized protein